MDFTKLGGLVPAVIQDDDTSEVLMVGFMNQEALLRTRLEGQVTFFSRTRDRLWTKGETSGNRLAVRQVFTDCDRDAVLVRVVRLGAGIVCHTGERSCFHVPLPAETLTVVEAGASACRGGDGEPVDPNLDGIVQEIIR